MKTNNEKLKSNCYFMINVDKFLFKIMIDVFDYKTEARKLR